MNSHLNVDFFQKNPQKMSPTCLHIKQGPGLPVQPLCLEVEAWQVDRLSCVTTECLHCQHWCVCPHAHTSSRPPHPPSPKQTNANTPPPPLPPNSLLARRCWCTKLDSVAQSPRKVSGFDFCPAECRLHLDCVLWNGFKINKINEFYFKEIIVKCNRYI